MKSKNGTEIKIIVPWNEPFLPNCNLHGLRGHENAGSHCKSAENDDGRHTHDGGGNRECSTCQIDGRRAQRYEEELRAVCWALASAIEQGPPQPDEWRQDDPQELPRLPSCAFAKLNDDGPQK